MPTIAHRFLLCFCVLNHLSLATFRSLFGRSRLLSRYDLHCSIGNRRRGCSALNYEGVNAALGEPTRLQNAAAPKAPKR